MKRILIGLIVTVVLLQLSCKKETTDTKVVKVSYPAITLNGQKYVTLNVGQSYDDPGAAGTDDISGATSALTAEYSSLDVTHAGLYYMRYTMTIMPTFPVSMSAPRTV